MDINAILELAKQSAVVAGFFYLLFYLIKNMEKITENLSLFGGSLNKMAETMLKLDMRMEVIESRLRCLEEKI